MAGSGASRTQHLVPSSRTIECGDSEFELLARELLQKGITLRFRARGASMSPSVRDGDVLHVRAVQPEEFAPGDLVLCTVGAGKLVAHRVLSRAGEGGALALLVKGDRVPVPDGMVALHDVLGKVHAQERRESLVSLTTRRRQALGRALAWASLHAPGLLPGVGAIRARILSAGRR
jgi:signal peptidase I